MKMTVILVLSVCFLSYCKSEQRVEKTTFDNTIACYEKCIRNAPRVLKGLGFTSKEMKKLDIRDICREFCMTVTDIKEYLREPIMNDITKEYVDLIDNMLSDNRFENQAVILSSIKRTILKKSKVSPGQINTIEKIHAEGR